MRIDRSFSRQSSGNSADVSPIQSLYSYQETMIKKSDKE